MIILKSKLGNITSRFKRNRLPTKEEIEALSEDEKALAAKSMDTVITDLRNQYTSAKEGRPIPDKVISGMLNSKIKTISLKEIDERISELEEINRQYFSSTDPLYNTEQFGIKYDIPIEGKTNKEWTTETIESLYNQLGESPSTNLLFALYYFIGKKTDGRFSRDKSKWISSIGKEISRKNPKPLVEIFKLRLNPDVTDNVDRKLFNYFTDKYKYTTSGIKQIPVDDEPKERKRTVISGEGKVSEEAYTDSVAKPRMASGNLVMGERVSIQLQLNPNIDQKLNRINLSNFRELITNLNKTNSSQGLFSSAQGPYIDILYEVMRASGISNLVREVQLSRKGEASQKQRTEYLTNWALSYINKRREEGDTNIGGINLESKEAIDPLISKKLDERSDLDNERIRDYHTNKNRALDYLKRQVRVADRENFVNDYKDYVRERKRLGDEISQEYGNSLSDMSVEERTEKYNEIVQDLNLSNITENDLQYYVKADFRDLYSIVNNSAINSRFKRALLTVLLDAYFGLDEEEYQTTVNKFITVQEEYTDYIPTGKIFSNNDKNTFIDSMRALITIFRRSVDRTEMSAYNNVFDDLAGALELSLDKVYEEGVKELLLDDDDRYANGEEIVQEYLDEVFEDVLSDINSELEALDDKISELLLDSSEALLGKLKLNIQDIAEDTTDKYKKQGLTVKGRPAGIREYLISRGYLQTPRPSFELTVGNKKYLIDEEDKSVTDMYQEIKYYEQKEMGGQKVLDKENPLKTTIKEQKLGE